MKAISIIFFFSAIFIFYGCFSEVESTPKITYHKDDFNKNNPIATSLTSKISNAPFKDWDIGKKFIVTDNKAKLALYSNSNIDSLSGCILRYAGFRDILSITGTMSTDIFFLNENGDSISYHVNFSYDELINRSSLEIPFLVQESLINDLNNLVRGKTFYILTSSWKSIDGTEISGKKFVPVKIEKASIGNAIYPAKIIFIDSLNNTYFVYITIDNKHQSTRNFESVFSLSDPRNKYPHINNLAWDYITNGTLKIGMTQEECRLSIGYPQIVKDLSSTPSLIKQWEYENGYILIFENGFLKEFKR